MINTVIGKINKRNNVNTTIDLSSKWSKSISERIAPITIMERQVELLDTIDIVYTNTLGS